MTEIFLAWSPSGHSRLALREYTSEPGAEPLNMLVSFVYLNQFRREFSVTPFPVAGRMLDSGAYSAWRSGKTIEIQSLIRETKNAFWSESVALDVIGDASASLENALLMKANGSPAIPVFHYGDPWEILLEYKREFPKVGLSCRFGEPRKASIKWLEQCFARAWPYRFHSFGWVDGAMLRAFPFHTADTASWNNGPAAFGRWQIFNRRNLPGLRGTYSIRAEIDFYLRLQTELRQKWKKELAKL